MTSKLLTAGSVVSIDEVLTWLIQSTVLLAVGLVAGRFLKGRGPAVQSALYRTVLVAVILCPIASASMAALGFSGLLIRLPALLEHDRSALTSEPVVVATLPLTKDHRTRSEPDDVPVARPRESIASPRMRGFSQDRVSEAGDIPLPVATVAMPAPSNSSFRWADVIGWGSNVVLVAWLVGAAALGVRLMRILDSTRTLSTKAGWRAIVATLLSGMAGTLVVGMLGVGGGYREVRGDSPKVGAKSAIDKPTIPAVEKTSDVAIKTIVKGRVVGPDGQPIAGATVAVGRYRRGGIGYHNHFSERQELDRSTTDREGRFRLTFEDREPGATEDQELSHPWTRPAIVAWAPGFGPASPRTFAKDVTEDKPLQLVRDDVPITARVVDLEGRPVKDATIRVHMVECPESTQAVDRWVEDASKGPAKDKPSQAPLFPSNSRLPGVEPAVSNPATTDGDGRFRLSGLGRDRLAILDIRGPSIAFRRVNVIARRMKRLENTHRDGLTLFDGGFHGADGAIVVEPGQPIEGAVRDAETKAPISGAIVTAMQLANSFPDIEGLISTVTDANGHYRLVGLPKASGHKVSAYPPLDRPYFITQSLTVPAGPGLETIPFDINLKRGIWITGRVTDLKTGEPVRAAIHYYPFLSNTLAGAYPNFKAGRTSLYWTGNRYRTDADGRFRLVGLPGRGIVAAKTFDRSFRLGAWTDSIPEWARQQGPGDKPLPTYNHIHASQFQAIAAIDPPAGSEEFSRDLSVQSSPSLTVQLVDPRGKPITNAKAWGRFPVLFGPIDVDLYDQSRARIVGLDPKAPRMVVFQHEQRKLGAVLLVSSEEAAREPERTVTLRPCATVTGRIVDADGKPASGGVHIRVASGQGERDHETTLFPVPIDSHGRFRIDSVIPDATYTLRAKDRLALGLSASGKMEPERFKPFELARNLTAKSGQVIELGTFSAATGQRVKEKQGKVI